ncbi:GTP-binding elongation factor EF-Tu/EF-1A, partial [Helicosporidium sp. ATCC 50920]
ELDLEESREHLNVVFIGHVDAGKSTTAGQILLLTGGVDERTVEKYEREAKEKNRESWYIAYIMDTNEEERLRGKTVEVGRAHFETERKRYTILDAPGHKSYVPNMISGASQADVGVLIISARKGEFETGYERGGQTREHVQLAKTLGILKIVVIVNKMDDSSVICGDGTWSQERYDEIQGKLLPFLKGCGYNPKKDVTFLPASGLQGHNIKLRAPASVCPWYEGPSLFEVLDDMSLPARDAYAPFRMPVMDRYKDMGTVLMGKSEAGLVRKGDTLLLVPNKAPVKVLSVHRDETEVSAARPGENLRLRVSGVEEDDVSSGFVLCSPYDPVPEVRHFEVQLVVLDLMEHKPLLTGGYKAIIHIHAAVEECEVTKIVSALDPKTREPKKVKFVKSGAVVVAHIRTERTVCVEPFDRVPQLGRFTLRDEGKTIAIGKILRLLKPKKKVVATAEA